MRKKSETPSAYYTTAACRSVFPQLWPTFSLILRLPPTQAYTSGSCNRSAGVYPTDINEEAEFGV